jgi:hypothetical protein
LFAAQHDPPHRAGREAPDPVGGEFARERVVLFREDLVTERRLSLPCEGKGGILRETSHFIMARERKSQRVQRVFEAPEESYVRKP